MFAVTLGGKAALILFACPPAARETATSADTAENTIISYTPNVFGTAHHPDNTPLPQNYRTKLFRPTSRTKDEAAQAMEPTSSRFSLLLSCGRVGSLPLLMPLHPGSYALC
jgi:hypothetical protein